MAGKRPRRSQPEYPPYVSEAETHEEADAVRKVKNEIVLRRLNERIEDHHLRIRPDVADWVCECADENCAQPVKMSIAEYEAIRVEPTQFFVAPTDDHVSPDIEYVVRREPSYWVLAKTGVGADMSRREHPRRQ